MRTWHYLLLRLPRAIRCLKRFHERPSWLGQALQADPVGGPPLFATPGEQSASIIRIAESPCDICVKPLPLDEDRQISNEGVKRSEIKLSAHNRSLNGISQRSLYIR